MNLEKLIKLVKLANNNPNENEANLAARKVCKMIAEADYKFGETAKTTQGPRSTGFSSPYSNSPMWEEFFGSRTYRPRPNPPKEEKKKDNDYYYKKAPPRDNPFKSEPLWNEPINDKVKSKNRVCSKCSQNFNTYNIKEPFVCFACELINFSSQQR